MNDVGITPKTSKRSLLAGLGRVCGILLLFLVGLQFCIVMGRYLLAINFLWLQELAQYVHASIFMLAAAWGLSCNRHVRIDILADRLGQRGRSRVEQIATLALLVPTMMVILITSWPYMIESWSILEGSAEVSGLPGVFLVKSLLPLFAVLMIAVGVGRVLQKVGR